MNKNNINKKILSISLAVVMLSSGLPYNVFATDQIEQLDTIASKIVNSEGIQNDLRMASAPAEDKKEEHELKAKFFLDGKEFSYNSNAVFFKKDNLAGQEINKAKKGEVVAYHVAISNDYTDAGIYIDDKKMNGQFGIFTMPDKDVELKIYLINVKPEEFGKEHKLSGKFILNGEDYKQSANIKFQEDNSNGKLITSAEPGQKVYVYPIIDNGNYIAKKMRINDGNPIFERTFIMPYEDVEVIVELEPQPPINGLPKNNHYEITTKYFYKNEEYKPQNGKVPSVKFHKDDKNREVLKDKFDTQDENQKIYADVEVNNDFLEVEEMQIDDYEVTENTFTMPKNNMTLKVYIKDKEKLSSPVVSDINEDDNVLYVSEPKDADKITLKFEDAKELSVIKVGNSWKLKEDSTTLGLANSKIRIPISAKYAKNGQKIKVTNFNTKTKQNSVTVEKIVGKKDKIKPNSPLKAETIKDTNRVFVILPQNKKNESDIKENYKIVVTKDGHVLTEKKLTKSEVLELDKKSATFVVILSKGENRIEKGDIIIEGGEETVVNSDDKLKVHTEDLKGIKSDEIDVTIKATDETPRPKPTPDDEDESYILGNFKEIHVYNVNRDGLLKVNEGSTIIIEPKKGTKNEKFKTSAKPNGIDAQKMHGFRLIKEKNSKTTRNQRNFRWKF